MKTYNLFYAVMALLIIGCSKSDDGSGGEEKKDSVDADYTLLLDKNEQLTGTLLNADAKSIKVSSEKSGFETVGKPQLTFEEGTELTMYRKRADCSGEITKYDFKVSTSETYTIFTDMPNCALTVNAIAHAQQAFYIAYEKEISEKESDYFVRILDTSTNEPTFVDIELGLQPIDLAFANNRLFILTLDGKVSEDFKLSVMRADTFDIIHEMNLGVDAKRIFKNPEGNIIIGYQDLHTTLNSKTMAFEFTNYGQHKEPNFLDSRFRQFDKSGKMYYDMPPGTNSIYPMVAAIYDFGKNNTVLYAYENFLSEVQRNIEFEIETTTMVGYDEKNNLLLMGYEKSGGNNKGGLIRIKLGSEPELVDNLDLKGIPYAVYIE